METTSSHLGVKTDIPGWVKDLQKEWAGQSKTLDAPTAFMSKANRGLAAIEVIKKLLPDRVKQVPPIHVCEVGIGLKSDTIIQPYEPYVLAAQFESMRADYRLTLIDMDKRPLDHIKTAKWMFMADYSTDNPWRHSEGEGWKAYLKALNIQDEIVKEETEGLIIFPGVDKRLFDQTLKQGGGYRKASLPQSLLTKIENNEIAFINDDIATTDLLSLGKIDFISCTNVMYQLSRAGQRLAMWNMAQAIHKSNGILFIDDVFDRSENISRSAFLPKAYGWLTEEEAKTTYDLSMSTWFEDDAYQSVVLQPIKD